MRIAIEQALGVKVMFLAVDTSDADQPRLLAQYRTRRPPTRVAPSRAAR